MENCLPYRILRHQR